MNPERTEKAKEFLRGMMLVGDQVAFFAMYTIAGFVFIAIGLNRNNAVLAAFGGVMFGEASMAALATWLDHRYRRR